MLPAMLHCLKNCDQDAAWKIYPKGVWFGKGQVQQEGVQVQKKGSHLQKICSKVHEKCPGPKEMERGPKKKVFRFFGTVGFSSQSNLLQEANVGKLRRLVGQHLDRGMGLVVVCLCSIFSSSCELRK